MAYTVNGKCFEPDLKGLGSAELGAAGFAPAAADHGAAADRAGGVALGAEVFPYVQDDVLERPTAGLEQPRRRGLRRWSLGEDGLAGRNPAHLTRS